MEFHIQEVSYLFYGLPETGKTSMIQALLIGIYGQALFIGMIPHNVCYSYFIPIHSDMINDSLRDAVNNFPHPAIIVFEGIGSLCLRRIHRFNKVSNASHH